MNFDADVLSCPFPFFYGNRCFLLPKWEEEEEEEEEEVCSFRTNDDPTRPNPKARSPGGYKREEQQKAFAAHTHKSGKSSGLFGGRGKDGKWPLFVVKQGGGRLLRSHSGAGNGREGDTVRSFGLAQIGTFCRRGILSRMSNLANKKHKKRNSPPPKKNQRF